jgi:hypothetical protein
MTMEYCFISGKLIVDLIGEADNFPAYLLSSASGNPLDAKAFTEKAFGNCYAKHLAESNWGAFWYSRTKDHFIKNLGLSLLGDIEGNILFLNPRTKTITWLQPLGISVEFPSLETIFKGKLKDGLRYIQRKSEMNIDGLDNALALEIQTGLKQAGEFSMHEIAQRLDVLDCFLRPELLHDAKLVFNKKLKRYWDDESISAECVYWIVMPEKVVEILAAKMANTH